MTILNHSPGGKPMLKIFSAAALAATLTVPAMAYDLGGAVNALDKASKDPKAAGQSLGDAAGQKAMDELTKKLKNVQNEKGPIVFKTGKADIDAKKCERTLKSIDGIIKQYPAFRVQIEGHTDNKGKADVNLKLSQARAEAVVAWLTSHLQTPADHMTAKGFGDTQPIADNKTEKGRAKNRRVDFSVTKL
jgi:outer membrane protein OmpA-like peptidoglycan-associated protein